jgi:hypothetical protein
MGSGEDNVLCGDTYLQDEQCQLEGRGISLTDQIADRWKHESISRVGLAKEITQGTDKKGNQICIFACEGRTPWLKYRYCHLMITFKSRIRPFINLRYHSH